MEHVGHAHVAVSGLRQDDDRGPTLVVSDVPLSDVKQDTSAAGSSNGIHMAYAEDIPYPELMADDADCLAAAESPFNYGAASRRNQIGRMEKELSLLPIWQRNRWCGDGEGCGDGMRERERKRGRETKSERACEREREREKKRG